MKQKRNIAAAVLLALVFSLLHPSVTVQAAPKNFTYAEQRTGAAVTSLFLEPGQQVDLKFIGVSDYKNYERRWSSSNESVAVVDSAGVITAIAAGTTTIKLIVGDSTAYTSTGVTVTVGRQNTISLGTSGSNTFSTAELQTGSTMDLGFYGMQGWDPNRYTCAWISTNPVAATVDQAGVVTPRLAGTRTFIMLLITDKYTTSSLTVTPVELNIVDKLNAAPTATPVPTAVPTRTPGATATPAPTAVPTQAPASDGYTVAVTSIDSISVQFSSEVSVEEEDISLYLLEQGSGYRIQEEYSFDITWLNDGTEAVIKTGTAMYSGDRYKICFGSGDEGTVFEVFYEEPNRVEVVYECMGQEGSAFAQLIDAVEMPVTLSYRLYYNNVDVTDIYDDGYAEFELISPSDSSYIEFDDRDELFFHAAKKTAVVRAAYYYEKNGKEVILKSRNTSITAKSPLSYSISIEAWTIIDDAESDDIDWSAPVHKVIAGTGNHRIVLLLKDSYGTLYSTDSRGEDASKNIFSLTDSDTFFGALGYRVELASNDMDEVLVEADGSLEVYEDAKTKASVYLTLYNEYTDDFNEKKAGTLSMQILAAPKLSSIMAEAATITLPTDCLEGFEDRFCRAEIEIKLYDQYGGEWEGDSDLELSCNNKDIDDELGGSSGPAYIDGTILHLDAQALWAIDEDDSLTFTIKETEINKRATVKVTLKKPTYASDGNLKISGWDVGAEDVKITFEDNKYILSSAVEVFQTSKSLNVGLFTNVTILERTNYTPGKDAEVDDVFLMVIDPKGNAVPLAENENSLGAYWDADDNCVRVNVTAPGNGKTVEFLETGKYRIKAVRVTSKNTDGTPATTSDTAYFTVSEDTGDVVIKGIKDNKTEIYVADKEDANSVAEIIEELFRFTLNGKNWEVTEDMISNVTFTRREKYIVIKSIELKVPIGDTGYSYVKTIKNINKSIQHGVDE